ncbi:hypothetical protein AB0L35_38080 [Streptomyces sp. NPDC052309]|uniref:hypothetical protein n=1 Tax=Streptomyces sp. NPDC052309 TaxID=3155421 RepID=UPI0034378B24
MLTPFDDYPVHQTGLPLAQAGGGHPDHYDRFWFNGYTEDFYFALALGTYPNRGVIDASFSVVYNGVQRSVFASGRIPLDRTDMTVGPITIEIVEPLRVNRILVDAPDHGLRADLTFRTRTAAYEEPRQTFYNGTRLSMDVTRATQLGTWTGTLESGGVQVPISAPVYGTKDRSWGVRPVGQPAPAAPHPDPLQIFFLWAPLNFTDTALHYMVFEDSDGRPWSKVAALLPVIGDDDPVYGNKAGADHVDVNHEIDWQPGLRRARRAGLLLQNHERGELEPLLTFRMKGAGYWHPQWSHGTWHDELAIGGEEATVEELDRLTSDCVHVQQVVRATWGDRHGLGVLEQLVYGPHAPSGFHDVLDGAPHDE